MLKRITVPGESIPGEEGSEDTDGTDTDSMGNISESLPDILSTDSGILSPDIPPSPAHTQSYGKAKRLEEHFIKVTKVKE